MSSVKSSRILCYCSTKKRNMIDATMNNILSLFGKCMDITEDCYQIIVENTKQLKNFNYQNDKNVIQLYQEFIKWNNKLNICKGLLQ